MKININRLLLTILFPVVFIFLFFLFAGTVHGATCWIGFAFAIFSFLVFMATPMFVSKSKSSHIFGFTAATMTGLYFGITFIFSVVFMIWDFEQWAFAVGAEIILLVAFLLLFLPVLSADEKTAADENIKQEQIYSVKAFATKAKLIAQKTTDLQIRKMVGSVYDELNSMPSNTNSSTCSVDSSISQSLNDLERAVDCADSAEIKQISDKLIFLIRERKELSKY